MSSLQVQWSRNLTQNLIAFLSLPWLNQESNGLDLEFFKDKGYKQCSSTLIQNTPGPKLIKLKQICIELLCLIPKNFCQMWRCNIISKCIREEPDQQVRICAIKYLPYLIYFLGVSSNSFMFQLIPPALNSETSLEVLKEYGNLLNFVCCLISRKSIIIRKSDFCRSINIISDFNAIDTGDDNIVNVEMSGYFELLCTCCDKKRIDTKILPKITKRRNLDLFQTLYNRPKYVDTQILMTFVSILSR